MRLRLNHNTIHKICIYFIYLISRVTQTKRNNVPLPSPQWFCPGTYWNVSKMEWQHSCCPGNWASANIPTLCWRNSFLCVLTAAWHFPRSSILPLCWTETFFSIKLKLQKECSSVFSVLHVLVIDPGVIQYNSELYSKLNIVGVYSCAKHNTDKCCKLFLCFHHYCISGS